MHIEICSESHSKDICQGRSASLAGKNLSWQKCCLLLVQSQPLLSFSNEHREKTQIPFLQRSRFNFWLDFSLRCSGRVCYLGWGSLAVLGLIDASECNPTFGAGEMCALTTTNSPHSQKSVFSCICILETMKTSVASSLEDTQSWTTTRVLSLLWYEAETLTIKTKSSYFTLIRAPSSLRPTLKIPIKVLSSFCVLERD